MFPQDEIQAAKLEAWDSKGKASMSSWCPPSAQQAEGRQQLYCKANEAQGQEGMQYFGCKANFQFMELQNLQ